MTVTYEYVGKNLASRILTCDCPVYRRQKACQHVVDRVRAEEDFMPDRHAVDPAPQRTPLDVPMFLTPAPLVIMVDLLPIENKQWEVVLSQVGWKNSPYEKETIGFLLDSGKRMTVRDLLINWIISKCDQEHFECDNPLHTGGQPEEGPLEYQAGSLARTLTNHWYLMVDDMCLECHIKEEALL